MSSTITDLANEVLEELAKEDFKEGEPFVKKTKAKNYQ